MTTDMIGLDAAKKLLAGSEGATLAVVNGPVRFTSSGRGVRPLYDLLTARSKILKGASVADKVIGRGAAALMVLAEVSAVYAPVVSRGAVGIFASAGVYVEFDALVDYIVNRSRTEPCPVEALTENCATAEECLPIIEKFLNKKV